MDPGWLRDLETRSREISREPEKYRQFPHAAQWIHDDEKQSINKFWVAEDLGIDRKTLQRLLGKKLRTYARRTIQDICNQLGLHEPTARVTHRLDLVLLKAAQELRELGQIDALAEFAREMEAFVAKARELAASRAGIMRTLDKLRGDISQHEDYEDDGDDEDD